MSAEAHSKLGVELYAAGKLPEAVREMLKAYELAPEPGLLYNIARIYQKMGERDLALHYFKKFVTLDGADPDRVQKALQHLEALKTVRVTPVLTVDQAPPPAPEAPSPAASEAPIVLQETTPHTSPDRSLEWSLIASGGAAIVIGGVLGVLALDSASSLEDAAASYEAKRVSQQDAKDFALGSDIALGVGIAAATAGMVLFLLPNESPAETSSAQLLPALSPSHLGADFRVSF